MKAVNKSRCAVLSPQLRHILREDSRDPLLNASLTTGWGDNASLDPSLKRRPTAHSLFSLNHHAILFLIVYFS